METADVWIRATCIVEERCNWYQKRIRVSCKVDSHDQGIDQGIAVEFTI